MAISQGSDDHRAWIVVDGQQFPVLSGSVEQAATRKSSTFSCVIPLAYPGAEAKFKDLGDNEAKVLVQSHGDTQPLIEGEIDKTDFDYIGGTISITGRDKSAKLHEKKTAEKWLNKQHDEIAADLAGRVGLGTDIDSSLLKAGKIMQADWAKMTDGVPYAFVIHKVAEFLGARWWVRNGVLMMKAPDNPDGFYTINYSEDAVKRGDITSLHIDRNIQAGKPIKAEVKSFHVGKKQVFTGSYNIGGNGSTKLYNFHLPGLTQDHADKHAKSKAKEVARHELTLTTEMVGDVAIDVSKKLRLIGTPFAQDFDMDSVHHSFGMAGHTMNITAKSAKQGRDGAGGGGASAKSVKTSAPSNKEAGAIPGSAVG